MIGFVALILAFIAVAAIGWTKDEFTITYYYGFDGKYETATVKKGYVKEPLAPGRYGHIFDGWYYTDKQGNEILFDFESDRVTTNLELTAHWKPMETELLLILPDGHGECEFESIMLPYESEYTLPEATREGCYFVGWRIITGFMLTDGVWTYPIDTLSVYARWSKFRPGTTYFIGEYYQNSMSYDDKEQIVWEKEPIEWIPIDKKDGKYLLVSKYIIDAKSYDSDVNGRVWEKCDLREWLNGEFLNSAFSEEERNMICDFYDENLGTTDKVFLPSEQEVRLLYGPEECGSGTLYANEMGFDKTSAVAELFWQGIGNRYYQWILRPEGDGTLPTYCGGSFGITSPRLIVGIRPAIWVDADKLK